MNNNLFYMIMQKKPSYPRFEFYRKKTAQLHVIHDI